MSAQYTADQDVHALVQPGRVECGEPTDPPVKVTEWHHKVTCLACRRAIGSASLSEQVSRGKVRAAAQEIANRERYPVHVGCGGEVNPFEGHATYCHRCDLAVNDADVVEPHP